MKWFIQENAKKQCTSAKHDLTNYKKNTNYNSNGEERFQSEKHDRKTNWCENKMMPMVSNLTTNAKPKL